jgi:hypothetical protein
MNIRHGDMALISIDKLPEGLKKKNTKVLMTGSGGNDHTFSGGEFYPHADGQIVGYFVAQKGAKLFHPEHGDKTQRKVSGLLQASVDEGVYSVTKQIEDTHEGMKAVED